MRDTYENEEELKRRKELIKKLLEMLDPFITQDLLLGTPLGLNVKDPLIGFLLDNFTNPESFLLGLNDKPSQPKDNRKNFFHKDGYYYKEESGPNGTKITVSYFPSKEPFSKTTETSKQLEFFSLKDKENKLTYYFNLPSADTTCYKVEHNDQKRLLRVYSTKTAPFKFENKINIEQGYTFEDVQVNKHILKVIYVKKD